MVRVGKGRLPLTWSVLGATGLPNPKTPTALVCCQVLVLWWDKIRQGPVGGFKVDKTGLEMSCSSM